MLNLKNKRNEQTKQKLTYRENNLMVPRWKGFGEMGEKGEGIKKHKLIVNRILTVM